MLYTITYKKVFLTGGMKGREMSAKLTNCSERFVRGMEEKEKDKTVITECCGFRNQYRIKNVKKIKHFL